MIKMQGTGLWAGACVALLLAACGNSSETSTQSGSTGIASGDGHPRVGAGAPASHRAVQDDIIYFVMPDRFQNGDTQNDQAGIRGDKFAHGFDPTDKAFFHGGDMQGILSKMDYLEGLGVTAIWMTPIFKNKPVQGDVNGVSAGYHGYWITDFTQIDPHLGSNDDLKELVAAAHARGIKVIFDIITNHTADVIKYRECAPEFDAEGRPLQAPVCAYRAVEDYPYTVRQSDGVEINDGFKGDGEAHQTPENFAKLTDPTWAYTPYLPVGEETVKVPAWLNDPIYYHNRGESHWEGESSLYGDFASLDDVFTEHPRVVEGMIDIYKFWISEFGIDGFRVDTVRHVGMNFWRQVSPALIEHAKAEGLEHFFIFGEVFDPSPDTLSTFTRQGRLPSVLDFGFQSAATKFLLHGQDGGALGDFFDADDYYTGPGVDAHDLPTFLGNHDMGRFGYFIQQSPRAGDPQVELELSRLGHTLMYAARGVPVIYYGDEQGFTGDGNDQAARENMQPSLVESYNDNRHIGSEVSPAADNFDRGHPLYQHLKALADLCKREPALRSGAQITRVAERGLFAFSRVDLETGQELVVAVNASDEVKSLDIPVSTQDASWEGLVGQAGDLASSDRLITVTLPARDAIILKADRPISATTMIGHPRPGLEKVDARGGRFVRLDAALNGPAKVEFFMETSNGRVSMGEDLAAPYRLYVDPSVINASSVTISATLTPYGGPPATAYLFFPLDGAQAASSSGLESGLEEEAASEPQTAETEE